MKMDGWECILIFSGGKKRKRCLWGLGCIPSYYGSKTETDFYMMI